MKNKTVLWVLLLAAHVVLLILASTSFTVIAGLWDHHFDWQFLTYASQSGWGVNYQFPYSLPVVVTYLAAYGAGLAAYVIAWRSGFLVTGAVGGLLCAVGFASFAYELTHWVSEHYDSWIVSMPAPLLLLAIAAAVQCFRLSRARR